MTDEELKNKVETASGDEEEISFEEGFKRTVEKLRPHIAELWLHRKKFVYFNVAVLLIALVVLLFLVKPYYVSTVTILPDYGSKETSLSQLSSLASLAGVSVGQATPTAVYQNLLTSEAVLSPVIYAKYKTEEFPDSVNLIQYFKVKPDNNLPSDLQKRDMFLKEFQSLTKAQITIDMDRTTNIITVSAKMPEAGLSADVVNNIVGSLDSYIRTKRKSFAVDQLDYIDKRLAQVQDSLNQAENRLKDFREQNRMVVQSPELMLEQSRLTRNVEILDAVYLELSKQYELAKIDEIKDTPIVNVRDYAKDPIVKAGPHRLTTLIVILFLSAIVSGFYFMFKANISKYAGYVRNAAKLE
ncbi:MAG: Wzz/FepE/Etk N-terminal domain-containing protein [Candidatus Kryptoniota bacterium]